MADADIRHALIPNLANKAARRAGRSPGAKKTQHHATTGKTTSTGSADSDSGMGVRERFSKTAPPGTKTTSNTNTLLVADSSFISEKMKMHRSEFTRKGMELLDAEERADQALVVQNLNDKLTRSSDEVGRMYKELSVERSARAW